MQYNKLVIILLAITGITFAEDLRTGAGGTIVTTNSWTKVATRGYTVGNTGFDKLEYSPATNSHIQWGSLYHNNNGEFNSSISSYDFAQNRWDVLNANTMFHNEHVGDGGHPDSQFTTMSLRNQLIWFGGNSSSNQPETLYQTYWFDPMGIMGRPKWSGLTANPKPSPNGSGITNSAMNYDAFRDTVWFFPKSTAYTAANTITQYNPTTNLWTSQATTGTLPTGTSGGGSGGMAYRTVDHKFYYFGGQVTGSVGSCGTVSNIVSVFNPATNIWSTLTTTGGPPAARSEVGWAYSPVDDIFLMASGVTCPGGVQTWATDTWVLDMTQTTPTWTQLSPSVNYTIVSSQASFHKLSYDVANNVFIMLLKGNGTTDYAGGSYSGHAQATWVYAYSGAANYGRVTTTYTPSGTSFNHTTPTATDNQSYAYDPALAINGTTIYTGAIETGTTFPSSCKFTHPYASTRGLSGAPTSITSTCAVLDPEFGGTNDQSDAGNMQLAIVNSVPWAVWQKSNDGGTNGHSSLWSRYYNGTSWLATTAPPAGSPQTQLAGQVGYRNSSNNTSVYQGHVSLFPVGTTPTVAFIEWDKVNTPERGFIYVDQCSGTLPCQWAALGGSLNVNATIPRATSVSGVSDGANPWVCFTEETESSLVVITTTPQLYCRHWTGSSWSTPASLNVTVGNWTADVTTTFLGGILYVAWTEKTIAGNPLLYLATTNGTTKTLITGAAINKNTSSSWPNLNPGWAARPRLSNDGTSTVFITWEEQQDLNQPSRVYAASWNGTTLTYLGGALNVNTSAGSATGNNIAMYNTTRPVATWTENEPGSLGQVYGSSWNGTDWAVIPVATPTFTVTATALPDTTIGDSYSQDVSGWASGGTAPYGTWTIASGALPTGLSLNSSTGLISGTVSGSAGTFTFTVRATDSVSTTATSGSASILVNAAPSITNTSPLASVVVGNSYSVQLNVTGGTLPFVWDISAGSLTGSNITLGSTGLLSSSAATNAATYNFTARATDNVGIIATKAFDITVIAACTPPTITTTLLPTGSVGVAYSFLFTATGSATITWSGTGLPGWATLDSDGTLHGTPNVAATDALHITATNSCPPDATGDFDLTAVLLNGTSLSTGQVLGGNLVIK